MRHFIIILHIAICNICFANDTTYVSNRSIDSLLLVKINDYRVFHHKNAVKWDNDIYKMSQHHSTYQMRAKYVGHDEAVDVAGFDEVDGVKQRYHLYVPNSKAKHCSENALGGFVVVDYSKTNDSFTRWVKKLWKVSTSTLSKEQIMILHAVFRWDQSPPHKANMLSTFCSLGAVNIRYLRLKNISNSIFHKGRPTVNYYSYATMNFGQ